MRGVFTVLVFVFLFSAAHSFAAEYVVSTDKGLIARGEAAFNKNCSQCHGPKAAGTGKGPPLVHKIYHPNHHADVTFRWAVDRGVRSHHWFFGDMPKKEGVSPDEVEAIIQYVRKLQKEAGIF